MSGLIVILMYAVCLFMGFCGGIFGYYFAKRMENKKSKKMQLETITEEC